MKRFKKGIFMTKVVLNGDLIELDDEIEKGKIEFDLLQTEEDNENVNLEDTIEINFGDDYDDK